VEVAEGLSFKNVRVQQSEEGKMAELPTLPKLPTVYEEAEIDVGMGVPLRLRDGGNGEVFTQAKKIPQEKGLDEIIQELIAKKEGEKPGQMPMLLVVVSASEE
jgi:hypothetical protein